jgi:hypothetical protein
MAKTLPHPQHSTLSAEECGVLPAVQTGITRRLQISFPGGRIYDLVIDGGFSLIS